jgi:hypothetical protein
LNRAQFLAATAAAGGTGFSLGGPTLDSLLARMPAFVKGSWVEYSFDIAPKYAKRIGFGVEHTALGPFRTIETQIGGSVTACDPNTLKKSYLRAQSYGNLLEPHEVRYVALKAGPSYLLAEGTKEDALWLLDTDTLYTSHRATIVAQSDESVPILEHHVPTQRLTLKFQGSALRKMTIWLARSIPGGVARLEAVSGQDAFAMQLNSFGSNYITLVDQSFDLLRNQLTSGSGLGGGS